MLVINPPQPLDLIAAPSSRLRVKSEVQVELTVCSYGSGGSEISHHLPSGEFP